MIPDNHSTSVKRLHSLITRLRKEPETLKQYDEVIKDQIEKGVVERVTDTNDGEKVGHVHYLPHREVMRSDRSTTKLRVVYDASSKGPKNVGPSLNDCLYTGQSLTPLLFDILLRFRTHRLAITSDIEKAFLNISISPEHRNFLRFVWVNNIEDEDPAIEVFRFTRLVFGLTSSPYILNATIRHHLDQYAQQDPGFVKEVVNSLYVDDYTSGADDLKSASELALKVKQRMLEGGFNMRKFTSNSTELIQELQDIKLFSNSLNPTLTLNAKC
ncbi:uncharacterized protein LOC116290006 [Actinia tenebrosa]|uniref:Uncharacterized protein LOC116290006 n=1 Tax=Actinia tenebrosa TaxID=6105 RepID=A0A6P8HJH3_ACTTE|nr:uncharacterized protein LOC116290006 [Actinia tenebrosa]